MLNIGRAVLKKGPTFLFTLLQTYTLKYILKKNHMSAYLYKNRNIST